MLDSVRVRLTLWHVGVLALVLAVFSITLYALVAHTLYRRLDDELLATLEVVSAGVQQATAERDGTGLAASQALQQVHVPFQAIAVFDAHGLLLYERRGGDHLPVRLPSSGLSQRSRGFYSLEETTPESDDSRRGVLDHVRAVSDRGAYLVVVNQSLEPLIDQLDSLQNILSVAVPLALALAGLGGWFLTHKSLAPVAAISARARQISAESLELRLPVTNPRNELGQLAATFNELLERLSHSFSRQRQFMADASHELRTPLSAMRTAASVALQKDNRPQGEYVEALTIVDQQAHRLTRLVQDLFLLARADAGHPSLQNVDFYLDELLMETGHAAAVLAARKQLRFEVLPLRETPYFGDESLLRRMIWNLLDNAVKFTPPGGEVCVALESNLVNVTLIVADTGIGIPALEKSRIFERFYRVDRSRCVATEAPDELGAGLGLPIARWIAQAHGGHLELLCSDRTGSTFVVHLPVGTPPSR